MKRSKFSIMDTDHILSEIMEENESLNISFSKWVKEKGLKIDFTSPRIDIISIKKDGKEYDFWWNKNSENLKVKEKILKLFS